MVPFSWAVWYKHGDSWLCYAGGHTYDQTREIHDKLERYGLQAEIRLGLHQDAWGQIPIAKGWVLNAPRR